MKKISIVVPFLNEASGIRLFVEEVSSVITDLILYDFEVIFINDGSDDQTAEILRELACKYNWISLINLTRNFGKEAAMSAGLDFADGDAVIFMDSDLQHPPQTIKEFILHWEEGHVVVAASRNSRNTDSFLYRHLARAFYKVHNKISDVSLPENVGDFRLIDRKVAEQLRSLRESRRFMKGLFAWVGYNPKIIEYTVLPRAYGNSRFNRWRSWNFALEGITSFSTAPLRVWGYLGALISFIGLSYAVGIIVNAFVSGIHTPGYVTLLTAVVVLGGVQLIGIGIAGEYIGRIYMEVKRRPPYLVDNIIRAQMSKKDDR